MSIKHILNIPGYKWLLKKVCLCFLFWYYFMDFFDVSKHKQFFQCISICMDDSFKKLHFWKTQIVSFFLFLTLYFQVVWYFKTVKCDQLWEHTFKSSKVTEDNRKLWREITYVFFCECLIVQSNLKFDSTPITRHCVYNSKKICFGLFPILTAERVQIVRTYIHI